MRVTAKDVAIANSSDSLRTRLASQRRFQELKAATSQAVLDLGFDLTAGDLLQIVERLQQSGYCAKDLSTLTFRAAVRSAIRRKNQIDESLDLVEQYSEMLRGSGADEDYIHTVVSAMTPSELQEQLTKTGATLRQRTLSGREILISGPDIAGMYSVVLYDNDGVEMTNKLIDRDELAEIMADVDAWAEGVGELKAKAQLDTTSDQFSDSELFAAFKILKRGLLETMEESERVSRRTSSPEIQKLTDDLFRTLVKANAAAFGIWKELMQIGHLGL